MIDHNYAGSQDQPFPPEWIHAVCVASDTPIISASAWNDIKPETAFITDTDYQIEHFEFNVIKDLNRIFLAGTSELLDEVSEFVKGFSDSHQDGFSEHGGIKGDGFFAKRATLASKVSDLVKAHIPPEEKMDSLQRIYRRLIVSSLMPDVWEPQKRPGDKKSLNDVPFSMWKHQIDRINDVFIAIAEKNERGSSPEVLSDCFRAMVGIEPQIIHSDFQRKLTDSVVCMPCETSSSTGFASKNDNTKSALTCDSGAHVAESGENEVSNIQVDWDDIEPLSVHDAIPVYGDVWATVLQLTELEQSEKILKIGSEISYYFVHFFNSEASFKSFELPHFELSSPLADHEGLLLLSEMCLDSAKKSEGYYNNAKYRSCVLRLERALNAATLFRRYFHLEVSGEPTMTEEDLFGLPYYLGYGSTEGVLESVPLKAKIELLESYGNWSKYTSDVRIDTLPMLYACLLDTALRSGIVPKRCKHCGGMFFPETPNQQYCHRTNKSTGIRCDNAELRRRTPGEKTHFNNVYQNIKKKASRAASKDWRVSRYYMELARFVHDTAGPLYRSSNKVDVLVYQQWLKWVIGPKFGVASDLSPDKRPFPVIWMGKVIEGNQPLYVNKDAEGYLFLVDLQKYWDSGVDASSDGRPKKSIRADTGPQISWNDNCAVLPIYYFIELLLNPKARQIVGVEIASEIPIPGLSECNDYLLGDEIE